MRFSASLHRRFESDGAPYVWLAESASVLRLDDLSDEILRTFSAPGGTDAEQWLAARTGSEDLDDARTTLRDLASFGALRPTGEKAPPAPKIPPGPFPLSTLVLNVTNKCNLSCTYCYEFGADRIADDSKQDGGARRTMMSVETAKQSIDFLIKSSEGRRELTVTFFGGETLLNFETVRAAALYAEEAARAAGRNVSFSLTTNATLLTEEVIDFLVAHRFGVNVSIDGGREDQNRHRVFKSGRGSYDEIEPRIRTFLERNRGRGRPIGARVTLTRGSEDVRAIYAHLKGGLGFDEVGFAPVTSGGDREWAFESIDYDRTLTAFGALAEDYVTAALKGEKHGFSNLGDLLREIHLGTNKAHPCGAGLGLLGVSTEGDLGLCHRFVESGEHEIGSISQGIDEAKRAEFLEKGHATSKIACDDCFARPVCAGGCYHEAYVRYGDASAPNLHACDWIRAWTELGLRSYGRIMNGNPSFFAQYEAAV